MDEVNKAIWRKFHVHSRDTLPYRGYKGTRLELAQLFGELGFTKGAEIGVDKGKYSQVLLQNNPGLKNLKLVDPWKAYTHHSDEAIEACYQHTLRRLAQYNDRVEYIRKRSVDGAKDVPDGSLDFVYIDGMHDFDNCMMDIITWVPKVRRGGIISGHDYYKIYGYGVIQAVDAYTYAHNISCWYMTNEENRRAEGVPSWFWVNY